MSEQAPFLDACPDHGELVFREGKCPICRRAAKNWAWKIETRGEGFVVRAWDHGFRRVYVATRSMAERIANLPKLEHELSSLRQAGVPCELFCPECKVQHIDAGEWATKLHRTHLCTACGHEWRPFEVATFGVESGLRQELEEAKRILEAVTLPSDHPLSAELRERWSRQFGNRTAEEIAADRGKSLAEVKAWLIDKRVTDLQAENEKLRAALQAVTEQEPGYGGPTATGRGYESCGRCEETSELAAKALKESTGRVTESPAGKP